MVRFLNTDNGRVVEASGPWVERYDGACNMRRLDASTQPELPRGDEWAEKTIEKARAKRKKTAAR